MDEEELDTDIVNARSLIQEHKRRLHLLRKQKAQQGAKADPSVDSEIEDILSDIRLCEQKYDILIDLRHCWINIGKVKMKMDTTLAHIQSILENGNKPGNMPMRIVYTATLAKQASELSDLASKLDNLMKQSKQML
jgi:hypothetical protein